MIFMSEVQLVAGNDSCVVIPDGGVASGEEAVDLVAVAPRPAESFCPAVFGTFSASASARNPPAPVVVSAEQATART
ncbi:hypothetical protein [Streptomyces sp. NPDC055749]